MTPNPSRPAAVDALQAIDDAIEELIECRVDVAIGNIRGDHSGGWKKLLRPLKRKLMEQIAALAAHHGPAAVDEALREAAKDVVGIAHAARFALLCPSDLSMGGWDFPRMNDDMHGALLRLQAALAKPAQEAAPRGGGEAVATVCLRGETYAHGHMIEVQLQIEPGTDLPVGTKLYAAPPAAQASDTEPYAPNGVPLDGDDDAARRYIADWCPDHVKAYIARLAQASEDRAGKDGERYRWLRDHRFDFIARNNGSKPQLHLPAGALPLNDAGVDALIDAAREAAQNREEAGTP